MPVLEENLFLNSLCKVTLDCDRIGDFLYSAPSSTATTPTQIKVLTIHNISLEKEYKLFDLEMLGTILVKHVT